MYINIILLPILGSLIAGIRGRYIGTTGAHILTTLCLILSSILSIVAFYEVCLCQSSVSIDLFNWLNIESIYLNWGFIFDTLTVSILLPVLFVSSLVHLYSIDYMANDPHNQRFISYLSIFTFFMIILVTGNNYVVIFVGWEGIGISSYLLINFWFTRIQANKSAIKALTVNRIGDIFLTVGLFILLWICGHLDYITLFSLGPYFNENIITIAGLLLLIGAMAKSAQLGLHTWLPDAIEGPTPVSALIHAATLVTAGVYLIVRSSPLLEYAPTVLIVTTWVGTLTAFFAATTGLLQNDLKRVIAYSTCSQIGYLFIAVGLANYNVALFHLVNHAFFKALLFLAAGAVIHGMSDQQDIRRLGGLINFMPFVYTTILIGSLSLIAVPFLTGFYSKDLILELAYGQYQISGTVAYWLGTLSASLTAFYSYRLISLTFLTTPNAPRNDYIHAHEPGIITVIPLFILSLLSIGFGYIAKDLYVGIGTDALSDSLYQLPTSINLVEAEFALPLIIKLLPAIGTLLGATLSFYLYNIVPFNTIYISIKGRFIYIYLNGKWLFDIVYNNIINNGIILGLLVSKSIDRGIIEIVGPYGLSNNLISTSNQTRYYDGGGYITTYALYIILGILVFTSIILINLFIHNVIYINIIYIFIIILCSFTLLPKLSKV